jgi:predicted Fe-Mo cluster-binding NifX family protein
MKARARGRKIAVTVWGKRVSPVFDSARTLLIAEINGRALTATSRIAFDPEQPLALLQLLRAQEVMVIICGAVSEEPAAIIEAAGIKLIPFITGDVQQVLEHFLKGRALGNTFQMPGCGKNICCRGKIRRGRGIHAAHLPPNRMPAAPFAPLSLSAPESDRPNTASSLDAAAEQDKHPTKTNP